jgi:hypothetical protein
MRYYEHDGQMMVSGSLTNVQAGDEGIAEAV